MNEASNSTPTKDRPWRWLIAPALAALYPVVSLYADAVSEANVHDVLLSGAVLVAAAIIVALLFRLVFTGTPRASLAAVVFVIWCFAFSGYVRIGRYVIESIGSTPYRDYYLYGFWIFLIFPAMFFLWRVRSSDHRMEQIYKFVLLACVASVALSGFQGIRGSLQGNSAKGTPTSIWESDQPAVPASWKPHPMAQHRDIYYRSE